MPIQNRELGTSEQRATLDFTFPATATGVTVIAGVVPYLCNLDMVQVVAYGISGSPVAALWVDRFIVGSGETTYILGISFALGAFGTSGVLNVSTGVSLPQMGSTLNILQANDVITIRTGGTNAAVALLAGSLCLRPLNDVVKFFGVL